MKALYGALCVWVVAMSAVWWFASRIGHGWVVVALGAMAVFLGAVILYVENGE